MILNSLGLQLMLSLDLKMSLGLESASWFALYYAFIQKKKKKRLGDCDMPAAVQA